MDGKSGAPWYSGLPLKAMPDFAWMANIFEHDRISPSGINAVPTKRQKYWGRQDLRGRADTKMEWRGHSVS